MAADLTPSAIASAPDRIRDPSFATTLAHGFQILAAFRGGATSLSNGELATLTGLSRPTVSRLTYTLASLGYLRRGERGRFEVGLGVLAAAYPLLASQKIRQLARPLMRDYANFSGGTVSLTMPFGLDHIYIETVRTADVIPHTPEIGFTAPMAKTAAGRALLSLYDEAEIAAYIAAIRTERPEWENLLREATLPGIAQCRRDGFALSLGDWRPEILGVAAPIRRMPNGDCLAVNCGIPAFRFSREQVVQECGPRIEGLARAIAALAENL